MSENIYLIHGYQSSPHANWFDWLSNQLALEHNLVLNVLTLPHPNSPNPIEWDYTCDVKISKIDNLILIGHSLGCMQILRFLQQHPHLHNVQVILVAGFNEKIKMLPELDSFTDYQLNFERIRTQIKKVIVIAAKDDNIINFNYTANLASHLKAQFILLSTGKHFMANQGYSKLHVVYNELQKML